MAQYTNHAAFREGTLGEAKSGSFQQQTPEQAQCLNTESVQGAGGTYELERELQRLREAYRKKQLQREIDWLRKELERPY